MAKKESTLLQLVITLTLIALLAGVALAGVYSLTKDPIEAAQLQKKKDAINKVLPGFQGELNDYTCVVEGDKDPVTVNLAYQDGQLYGAAVETFTNKAFSGRFDIMVGLDAEGNILGTAVLKHSETPGLGAKITETESHFITQFVNKNPIENLLKVKKDGGDIDAITAATISSRAFCDAVNRAAIAFNQVKKETEKEENHE